MSKEKKYFPRLLIITVNALSDTNSAGNIISSHFGAWDNNKVANVFLRNERIDNKHCSRYFRITESDILKSMLSRKNLGVELLFEKDELDLNKCDNGIKKTDRVIESIKRIRPTSILFLREIFWAFGFRRKDKFSAFLKNFDPEVIHMHCPGLIYAHRVLHYCQKVTNAKVVLFSGDEIYSYKSFWPIDRLYQFILRGWIKETINISDINYAATPELCDYYSRIFGRDFRLLYKGALIIQPKLKSHKLPLRIVYTGNILYERWRSLSLIAKAIDQISTDRPLFKLEIYTHNALSKRMQLALNTRYSEVKGAVSFEEVKGIQSKADIVLHVESFTQKYVSITKYSFSTKIVDYIQNGSCIMAVGPMELASIEFLKRTGAALIASSYDEICNQLRLVISDSKVIDDLPWHMNLFVKDKFDLNIIRENLYRDIMELRFSR